MGSYLSFDFLAPLVMEVLLLMTLALSLNLINGCAGMFSLGHQGFYGLGAYAAGAFVIATRDALGPAALPASIVAGGLAAALFGLIVGIPCLRLKGDYLAIATLGFAEIFRISASQIDYVGGPRGLVVPAVVLGRRPRHEVEALRASLGISVTERTAYYAFYLAIAAALLLFTWLVIHNLMRSSHGRAIYAIREDEVAAELLGVDLTRYKVAVFLIGAGFAGLAGAVRANEFGYITPKAFDLLFGVNLLLYVVLGGQGRLAGSAIAVVILFGLERALATELFGALPPGAGGFVARWWQVIYALLLVAIVLVRPQGIMGKKSV
jgi:branched-chain amino acid transport system permease protein